MQGLCGLRVLEAAFLREEDIDLGAGTITVTETTHHRPKTRQSFRTIPLCGEAREALTEVMAKQKVRIATGEIFLNERGNIWLPSSLSHTWTRAHRRAAKETRIERLAKIPARRLRSAFATMASRLGAPDPLLKAYLGHSSGDVLGSHYRKIALGDLKAVSGVIDGWRNLPESGVSRKDPGNNPISEIATD